MNEICRWRPVVMLVGSLLILMASVTTQVAALPGTKAGWSISIDPRKRAFLTYAFEDGGRRVLVLGCLRDVNTFILLSEELPDATPAENVVLTLVNGQAHYSVRGKVEPDGISKKLGFTAETDVDSRSSGTLESQLMPVLSGSGPIVLMIGPSSRELPVAGIAPALQRFQSTCFGK